MSRFRARDIIEWTSTNKMPFIKGKQTSVLPKAELLPAGLEKLEFSGLSTDSRSLKAGEVFLALVGDNFDGHSFLHKAAEIGAGMLIVQAGHPTLNRLAKGPVVLEVPDTLLALQQIACGYRHQLRAKVIAVTGSVGKTSTREMISCCLSAGGKVHQTAANLNNEIGLPQTLLAANQEHDFVVVEMGMRGLGQIELLSMIACPDISVITNIGWSHLELLGSRENILKAKTEITAGMTEDSILIINRDDEMLTNWQSSGNSPIKTACYSLSSDIVDAESINIWAENIVSGSEGSSFEAVTSVSRHKVNIGLPGSHHISNALAGLLAAQLAGVDMSAAAEKIIDYKNTGKRQNIFRLNNICIMDDTYNAAPESMITAIRTIAAMAGEHRIIGVLAGMLELGSYSAAAHQLVGREAVEVGFSELCLYGEFSAEIEKGARQSSSDIIINNYDNHEKLLSYLKSIIKPGDYILVKGSRAFAMDKITAELEAYLEE